MLARPESALSSALDPLPEWMPRFEVSAMERLSWRLLPRLDGEARNRVRDLAEFTEGARGQTVLDELQSLGDAQ